MITCWSPGPGRQSSYGRRVSNSTPPDHAGRDRTTAISSYTTVLGRLSLAEEDFRAYWRDVHGPLCSRVPGLGWYVQHHFARHHDAHLWPGPEGADRLAGYDLDGAVEIGWADAAAQATFQEASSILFSDEQNVFSETAAYPLPAGSTTLLDRNPDATPNGADPYDRQHVHLGVRPGARDDVVELLSRGLTELAARTADLVTARIHPLEPHDNSTPNPPAPGVAHTVVGERVELVVLEVAFTDALARRRALADGPLAEANAALGGLVSHVTPFAVSSVCTFVRDGALTDAGLRGSRVAELITALAATNQVGDDVRHLMRTGRLAG
nr:EthD domain-containing protein [Microlunatus antarcticus]